MATKNAYYGYILLNSGKSGVASSWAACEKIVAGKPARYRGFPTESAAKAWVASGARYEVRTPVKLEPGIYFDAGTGRGKGVEVKVTNEKGQSLLHKALAKGEITEHDTYLVGHKGATNNYGELFGCYCALQIALKEGVLHIFGDSRLVIEYWSRGFVKKDVKPKETQELAKKVAQLRRQFEDAGGSIELISGDDNPADLGFHR